MLAVGAQELSKSLPLFLLIHPAPILPLQKQFHITSHDLQRLGHVFPDESRAEDRVAGDQLLPRLFKSRDIQIFRQ